MARPSRRCSAPLSADHGGPAMPSRPLSADRSAMVKLRTRIDVEAIDIVKHRTGLAAAVARLALLVPLPGSTWSTTSSPPWAVDTRSPHRLAAAGAAVRAGLPGQACVHAGEVKLRGPNGEVVDLATLVEDADPGQDG
jgi:hypothetical protein